MKRDNSNDETPFAVYCKGDSVPGQSPCGLVFLERSMYRHQMMNPNHGWYCPNCGSSAMWDDWCQETNPVEAA